MQQEVVGGAVAALLGGAFGFGVVVGETHAAQAHRGGVEHEAPLALAQCQDELCALEATTGAQGRARAGAARGDAVAQCVFGLVVLARGEGQEVVERDAGFMARIEAGDRAVPRFCEREVAAFLRCGILAHGFARVHCSDCGKDDVVAFSCKGRGFCPSCGTRRMVDTAAWLVDRVMPEVPVRQWVLSLPYRVRLLCAYDPEVCSAVRRVLVSAVSGYYERAARRLGKPRPRAGAVAFVQRFDSGLRLDVHLHVLWLDGVYAWEPGSKVEWCAHGGVNDDDVRRLVKSIRDRVLRGLKRLGKWSDETSVGDEVGRGNDDEQLLLELGSAAVQGRGALGEEAGRRDLRAGRGTRDEAFVKAPLCADLDGFSLHAAVAVPGHDRRRLERLCRYAGRPVIAESRLSLLSDGRVAYALKRRWRDGSTHVVLAPQVLIERLISLVPRPRRHLVTYHGVLAPAACLRSWIVPEVATEEDPGGCRHRSNEGRELADEASCRLLPPKVDPRVLGERSRGGRRRYRWAELMARVFLVDVLRCPCGGVRKVLAAIHDPDAIRQVLGAMGLSAEVAEWSPARGPPEQEWRAV